MRVAVGSDHRAIELKEIVKRVVREMGGVAVDFGAHSTESADYPDFAFPVARAVARGECDRGVLLCGTGIGMSIAANKVKGVRAAVVHDEKTAELSRQHNDANILCMGSAIVDAATLEKCVKVWLSTPFEGGRHARRVEKIASGESTER
ncbi:MAG TPA: ribose 5-phosphate isomerase B [Candidatus Brocadiia bacterium]|nr:ribose 5-phosphate isomerase B [Candidatus Brocadiia bacterium]